MEDIELRANGQNNGTRLYKLIDFGVKPEELLLKDRYLENYMRFDNEAEGFHRMYRRILADYDPAKKTVLISKEGSQRLIENLSIQDREFTLDELYSESWRVRPTDWKLDDGRSFFKWLQDEPNGREEFRKFCKSY